MKNLRTYNAEEAMLRGALESQVARGPAVDWQDSRLLIRLFRHELEAWVLRTRLQTRLIVRETEGLVRALQQFYVREIAEEYVRALRKMTMAFQPLSEAVEQLEETLRGLSLDVDTSEPPCPNPYHRLHMERRRKGRWW